MAKETLNESLNTLTAGMHISDMRFLISALLVLPLLALAEAESYSRTVTAKSVLRTARTSSGAPLAFPAAGGEVAGLEVTIPAGTSTGWHLHRHSGFAYVLSGQLRVRLSDSTSRTYQPGEAFAEVVSQLHEGTALGKDDVRLIAFFLADSGKPVSEKPSK